MTLAAAAFPRERLTGWAVGGVLIALVGVLLVLSNGDLGKLTILSGHPYTFAQITGGVIVVACVLLTSTRGRPGRSTPFFWRPRRTGNLEP